MFRLGVIVNPWAGIGGAVALKGSDGADTVAEALARGAVPKANQRMAQALQMLEPVRDKLHILTWSGAMGEDILLQLGFSVEVCGSVNGNETSPADTEQAAAGMEKLDVDLILFAGGDGTARNICHAVSEKQPVLGVPAGVKIHSGCYAITPRAAGEVVRMLVTGELVNIRNQEVRDIDETAFRAGRVSARYYGELNVPEEGRYMQHVKQAGREVESLAVQDIAEGLEELLEDDTYYLIGPGSTTAGLMEWLELEHSLLGVDVICNRSLVLKDATASQLLDIARKHPSRIIVTAIGGQGHIFGRGNQQFSPDVIRTVGTNNIMVTATRTKLKALEQRPLLVDTGDQELNKDIIGYKNVIVGYNDAVMYQVETV